MGTLQLFIVGGFGGMLPREILLILGVLRSILVHSEAYREAHTANDGKLEVRKDWE